jgi:isocitrate dehydrogenase
MTRTPVTVAKGDGIGPEIMEATLRILRAAQADLDYEPIDIGEQVYLSGQSSGIADSAWESLRRTKVFLKAPITTPQGGGYKSLNVTIRKTLGLYANVRPCKGLSPYVKTMHPNMDVVIVRENEEDLYAGIEHRQTQDVYQCLKLISRPGTERIIRYAFEYAVANQRKKVTCFSKDNIMKMTDGIFSKIFREVAEEYPGIESEHYIIDIGSARLATNPERFDVIVTSNLYGDIISDIAAEVSGSVGLGASVNLGKECAMFEAIHGSAPDIAGKDIANPSGLLLSAVMMLVHVGQGKVAAAIQNAWSCTLEDGIHTKDIYRPDQSAELVGTQAFADAVIKRLGSKPHTLAAVDFSQAKRMVMPDPRASTPSAKALVGVDVFVDQSNIDPAALAAQLQAAAPAPFVLKLITNRGVKVWPNPYPETFCVDHWRCRFKLGDDKGTTNERGVAQLLTCLAEAGVPFIKTEHLYTFDGTAGYSLGQGE